MPNKSMTSRTGSAPCLKVTFRFLCRLAPRRTLRSDFPLSLSNGCRILRRLELTLCLLAAFQLSAALAQSQESFQLSGANLDTGNAGIRDARYRLCATDVIALTFPLTPEFDQTVNIQPDGFASLAGAGSVRLAGLTTQESADAIRAAYAKVLHDPIVSVELKDFNKPYFIVSGQVNRPGKYDLRGDISATQAIAIAGGFTDAAKHSQVLLFRRANSDWYEVKPLNLKRILHGQNIDEDPEIHAGDMLYAPQNLVSKVKRYIPSSGFGAYYQLSP